MSAESQCKTQGQVDFPTAARTALAGKGRFTVRSRSRDRRLKRLLVLCDGRPCSSLQSLNGCTENRE